MTRRQIYIYIAMASAVLFLIGLCCMPLPDQRTVCRTFFLLLGGGLVGTALNGGIRR